MRFIVSLLVLSVAVRAAVLVPLELRADVKCSTDVRLTIIKIRHGTQTCNRMAMVFACRMRIPARAVLLMTVAPRPDIR
jgi:hypothetical protein